MAEQTHKQSGSKASGTQTQSQEQSSSPRGELLGQLKTMGYQDGAALLSPRTNPTSGQSSNGANVQNKDGALPPAQSAFVPAPVQLKEEPNGPKTTPPTPHDDHNHEHGHEHEEEQDSEKTESTPPMAVPETAVCVPRDSAEQKAVFPSPDLELEFNDPAFLKAANKIAQNRAKLGAPQEAKSQYRKGRKAAKKDAERQAKEQKLRGRARKTFVKGAQAKVQRPSVDTVEAGLVGIETAALKSRFVEQVEYAINRIVRKRHYRKLRRAESKLVKTHRKLPVEEQCQKVLVLRQQFASEFQTALAAKLSTFKQGFLTSETEKARFDFEKQKARRLRGMKRPEAGIEELGEIPSDVAVSKNKMPKIGSSVLLFLNNLKGKTKFKAGTYNGHSWGAYSVDFFLRGTDERGFYQHEKAVEFFLAADEAAKATKVEWRALYNDFSVAKEVNEQIGVRRIVFKKYHGPSPYILHVHMDVMPTEQPEKQDESE